MPTYEYECLTCQKRFEKFQSISAQPLDTCIFCGAKVRRLIGAGAGILFKGSGFYTTDYRSDSYKKGAAAETKQTNASPCASCPQGDTCSAKE